MNLSTPTSNNAAPSSHFIAAELSGGPYHGQLVNVPTDEFLLILRQGDRQYKYHRTGSAPIFRCESALVEMFKGVKR